MTALLAVVPDPPTPQVRARMQAMPTRDTGPELALRRAMHQLGLRWRNSTGPTVAGKPDVANRSRKVAVFVDGCFWHGCPLHFRLPKRNTEWWRMKMLLNIRRDLATIDVLHGEGWLVIRVWEHEDPAEAAGRIARAWRSR